MYIGNVVVSGSVGLNRLKRLVSWDRRGESRPGKKVRQFIIDLSAGECGIARGGDDMGRVNRG